jgi:signal peptidase II
MKQKLLTRQNLIASIVLIGILIFDQVTKSLAFSSKPGNEVLIPGVINLIYLENRGASYGILSDSRVFLIIISIVGIVLFLGLLVWSIFKSPNLTIGLAIISGGAIGNVVDRLFRGFVIDFLHYPFLKFLGSLGSFSNNIADLAMTVGIIYLGITIIFAKKPLDKNATK